MSLQRIAPRILRVPPEHEPLSADAFIIEGDERYYVYDVGASDAAFAAVAQLAKPVTVILSHFHRDHTANMDRLPVMETLVGARTRKRRGYGTVIAEPVVIRDGVEIVVQPCVSPHEAGCLVATVDGMYTLVGDLHYARSSECTGEVKGMYYALKAMKTQWFVVSHSADTPLIAREALLHEIRVRYGMN